MKAVILSAGRGSRLLPLTEALPKCLLPVADTTVLGVQLDTLEAAGVERATIVTGFYPHLVEEEVAGRSGRMQVETLYNPFFQVADNLASCWMARHAMRDDFLLINGDTLFEEALVRSVIDSPTRGVQVTIDRNPDGYDADDMKVTVDGEELKAIGKTLKAHEAHCESIGMLRFMGQGTARFTDMLEAAMRTSAGTEAWFLKAIDRMAKEEGDVWTHSIEGKVWAELDTPEDYQIVQSLFGG
ncbi:MAG: phosphocholine cytidylyltransferase family protein [Pseudomonadota bacterium]